MEKSTITSFRKTPVNLRAGEKPKLANGSNSQSAANGEVVGTQWGEVLGD
jgi:hypothetical protein